MQAMVHATYGAPDGLRLQEVDRPVPTGDQVLVRVHAASLNALDWHVMRGWPYFVRFTAGLRIPKRQIPGIDVAGRVEAVGADVTRFRPGDEVFGEKSRACAEYVAGPQDLFVHKPAAMTFEQAAALPAAGATALQALRDKGAIRAGQRVLIYGASGGVGTFAVQLAKAFGAEVTGVCRTENVERIRSIGADQVIDYTDADFTRSGERYDLVIDNVGDRSLRALRRVLTPVGTLVLVGAPRGRWILGTMIRTIQARLLTRTDGQRLLGHLTDTRREDLETLAEMAAAGTITPVIDRCYPLRELPDAMRHLETMHAQGKVIITI